MTNKEIGKVMIQEMKKAILNKKSPLVSKRKNKYPDTDICSKKEKE